jgi:hypothetical protein
MTDALSGEDFVTALEMIESSYGGVVDPSTSYQTLMSFREPVLRS